MDSGRLCFGIEKLTKLMEQQIFLVDSLFLVEKLTKLTEWIFLSLSFCC